MKIHFNKVTWYSKLAAVIVFVGTFALAFYLGVQYGSVGNNNYRGYPMMRSFRNNGQYPSTNVMYRNR